MSAKFALFYIMLHKTMVFESGNDILPKDWELSRVFFKK